MENGPFMDDFPSYKPPFILGIFHGYVSHNQRVYHQRLVSILPSSSLVGVGLVSCGSRWDRDHTLRPGLADGLPSGNDPEFPGKPPVGKGNPTSWKARFPRKTMGFLATVQ